ncbi:MAG: cytochrome c biogenesis protein ResB [Bacteroidales bacterium]|jgi:hypothetical protein|nr:cytochrome c biogenesis protein ResB [Bacteroidota bacterium]NLO00219.1 cytochrome c biogenesis protein ResB [Bacteroidales bacterium]
MSAPWGLILCLLYVYLLIVLYTLGDRFPFLRKLYGIDAGILTLAGMLVLLIVDGLFPFRVNRNPLFILVLLAFTSSVALRAIDELCHLRRHRIGVVFSHVALSLLLIAAIFGSGSIEKAQVMLIEGIPKAAGTDEKGRRVELPFALTLTNFTIESSDPERQRFVSTVRIDRPDGTSLNREIEVNHPVKVGPWQIYQKGYDTEKGRFSAVSVLECVKDPWYPAVRTGLWLMLAAALVMAVTSGAKKKEDA